MPADVQPPMEGDAGVIKIVSAPLAQQGINPYGIMPTVSK